MTRANAAVDVLVIGAGVFGLWAATRAVEAGLRVAIADAEGPGAGASGGLLGALTAHAPERWNDKKQFQLDALAALPALVAALEEETGSQVGYRRCGRLMPIRNAVYHAQVARRAEAAETHWRRAETGLVYAAETAATPGIEDWLAPEARPHGYVWDSLAARLSPRAYTAALWDRLGRRGALRLTDARYQGWSDGAARFANGDRLAAGAVVIAAGWRAFDLLAEPVGAPKPLGAGIKGQSAALMLATETIRSLSRAGAPLAERPLLYEDGVYVVPHDDGRVAVGGTNEKIWDDPSTVDASDDGFLRRARLLCPALRGAEIVERWAGVRPRAVGRDPMVGRLPTAAPIFAMAGGYKISFGIAHRLAERLVDEVMGRDDALAIPETFGVAHHLDAAGQKGDRG